MYVVSSISGLYIVVQVCCTQFLSTSLLISTPYYRTRAHYVYEVSFLSLIKDARMLPVNNGQINHLITYQLAINLSKESDWDPQITKEDYNSRIHSGDF